MPGYFGESDGIRGYQGVLAVSGGILWQSKTRNPAVHLENAGLFWSSTTGSKQTYSEKHIFPAVIIALEAKKVEKTFCFQIDKM